MPTVSWIREGDEERYYEAVAERVTADGPDPFPGCPHCGERFPTQDIAEHIRAAHPMLRPILLVDGCPAPSEVIIRRPASNTEIYLLNTSEALAEIDGGQPRSASREKLLSLLGAGADSIINLQLINTRAADRASAVANYKIKLRVPTEQGIRHVDRAFQNILTGGELSRVLVDQFALTAKGRGADEYADGLYQYAVGILAKDQTADSSGTVPFKKYAEKYQIAAAIIADIPSPLAETISSCIRFNLNEFTVTSRPTGVTALDEAIRFFAPLANGAPARLHKASKSRGKPVPACPIDHTTDAILQLVLDVPRPKHVDQGQIDQLTNMIASGLTTEPDRVKLRALLARRALDCGVRALAVPQLRTLIHDVTFGAWAENQLNNIGDA